MSSSNTHGALPRLHPYRPYTDPTPPAHRPHTRLARRAFNVPSLGEAAPEVYGKHPAAVALGERAAAYPAVAKWLEHEYCNLKKPPKAARE